MELQDIETFLTLAEERHFGRTAERLHLSAARVSQVIKKQERAIGARLFERTSRRVALTPLGQQLYDDLRPAHRQLLNSIQRAKRAAQGGPNDVLRLGAINLNAYELRPFWDAFRSRHPDWGLQIRHCHYVDAFAPLRNGEIDVLIAWLPVEEPDLTVGPVVFTELSLLMVAADHELAGRASVSMEVLGDHGSAGTPGGPLPDYWENAFLPFYTPSGRPIERPPLVLNTIEDYFAQVSTGQAIHSLAAQASRFLARPDIAYVPFSEAPQMRWSLVWRTEAENALIRALAQVVRELGTLTL